MADTGSMVIKGIREGLLVQLSPSGEWEQWLRELLLYVDGQPDFFRGARVALDVGSRTLEPGALMALIEQLEQRRVGLWAVLSENPTTREAVVEAGLETSLEAARVSTFGNMASPASTLLQVNDDEPPPIDPEEAGTRGVLVKRTLRNGRTVRSEGHVVVLGDVNPGAEIIAGGDVIIWGRLRGVVHAGAHGDESAAVCALDMSPMQLRIAGYIATSPPDKRRRPTPEMAIVRDERIVVETWA